MAFDRLRLRRWWFAELVEALQALCMAFDRLRLRRSWFAELVEAL
jgi:hypothetical protein